MLNIGNIGKLCEIISIPEQRLRLILNEFDSDQEKLVKELTIWPVDPQKKPRDVISVRGDWRTIQSRLYRRLFKRHFQGSRFNHGSTKRRSPRSNARVHHGSEFAYSTDVSNFFPSISCQRVNRFFLDQGCSYSVARFLTRLCTFDFHLALGLTTSPIIANEIFIPIDLQIARACRRAGLKYSRFVDDLCISGKYDLQKSGIGKVVSEILLRHGFCLSKAKTKYGRLDTGMTITGIRIKGNHLDASRGYIAEFERSLEDHISLSIGGEFDGPLLTQDEMLGKSYFICGLNSGRRRTILSQLKKIDWDAVQNEAASRRLVRKCEMKTARGKSRPDQELPVDAPSSKSDLPPNETVDHSIAPF